MPAKNRNKKRVNVSLDPETIEKLRELVEEAHTTVSQWITDAVWRECNAKKRDTDIKET